MEDYIKNLRIIYFIALITPILLIIIYILSIDKGTIMLNYSIDKIFMYLVPIWGIIFIPIGFIYFNKRLPTIRKEKSIEAKLQLYRKANIIRIAFVEGVAFFSVIAYFLTLNYLYIIYMLISLGFYIPMYPTINRIKKDLGISQDISTIKYLENDKQNLWNKKSWLIISATAIMIIINYNLFREYTSNKVVLPDITVDSGTIKDSIYHNNYLNWTFIIPKGYEEIPISEIEYSEKIANKYFNNETENNPGTPVRLLNISNGLVEMRSNLNPRALYPNLTDEDKYLKIIDSKFQNANVKNIKIEKQSQGELFIDNLKFKYSEYLITGPNGKAGLMLITRFNKDFIFEISLSYADTKEGMKLLNRIKNSQLKWE